MPIRGMLDRLVLLAAVLLGGALPGFIQQYRQRIGGRLDEARERLVEWQALADRLFGGDLAALVAHHRDSGDATFVAEAELIEGVRDRVAALEQVFASLQGSLPERLLGFLRHAEWVDVQATWSIFTPEFPLHGEGLVFAFAFGVLLWLLWLAGVHLCIGGIRRVRRGSPSAVTGRS